MVLGSACPAASCTCRFASRTPGLLLVDVPQGTRIRVAPTPRVVNSGCHPLGADEVVGPSGSVPRRERHLWSKDLPARPVFSPSTPALRCRAYPRGPGTKATPTSLGPKGSCVEGGDVRRTRRCDEGYTSRSHRAYPRLTRITRTSGNGRVDSERIEQSLVGVGGGEIVASPEALQMGSRLDEHHAPETNGEMSVCRRCGARTDSPKGRHLPDERQLDRALRWLDAQSLSGGIDKRRGVGVTPDPRAPSPRDRFSGACCRFWGRSLLVRRPYSALGG